MNSTKSSKIYIFGNPDIPFDSLPLRILPQLREKFPEIDFVAVDPNEDFLAESDEAIDLTIIDTAIGIKNVMIFDSLEKFTPAPHVGAHDFDALASLRLLQKLGKIKSVKIIAVPSDLDEEIVAEKVADILVK